MILTGIVNIKGNTEITNEAGVTTPAAAYVAIGDLGVSEYLSQLNGKEVYLALAFDDNPFPPQEAEDYNLKTLKGKVKATFGFPEPEESDEEITDLSQLTLSSEFQDHAFVGDVNILETLHQLHGKYVVLGFDTKPIEFNVPTQQQQVHMNLATTKEYTGYPELESIVFETAVQAPVVYQDSEYRVVNLPGDIRYYSISGDKFTRLQDVIPLDLVNRLVLTLGNYE